MHAPFFHYKERLCLYISPFVRYVRSCRTEPDGFPTDETHRVDLGGPKEPVWGGKAREKLFFLKIPFFCVLLFFSGVVLAGIISKPRRKLGSVRGEGHG